MMKAMVNVKKKDDDDKPTGIEPLDCGLLGKVIASIDELG